MLKPYDKQEDIPEELKAHYLKGADGKWHAEIPTDHPAIKSNATLLSDKQAAEAKVTQLESDLEHAKASSLPRGHIAVAKADAELLNEIKTLGTPAEIKTRLEEHKTLKDEVDKRKREDNLKLVAKELGYDNVDAFVRLPNLPEFEIRTKDGKNTVIAKVKEGENFVEKPAAEFIESSPDISPFLGALKKTEGVTLHGTSGDSNSGKDPFAAARDFGKNWNETAKAGTDIAQRFGIGKSA